MGLAPAAWALRTGKVAVGLAPANAQERVGSPT
eukprot:CAMPEP_0170418778 /NCGR_PEP_ID=MMETSP0117_2-20130122/34448_1 /TAXON_ID=400756 /ORGANISM="Durinskia baltica, Strain CSIRO CS-38" /LENGTH=32 /DNA_ID= /DNA_START= /DNA_END= /DNA_ORIENTATION=